MLQFAWMKDLFPIFDPSSIMQFAPTKAESEISAESAIIAEG